MELRKRFGGGAVVAAIAAAAMLAAPGTASAADSDSCATKVVRGYVDDVFTTVAFDTTAQDTARVCFRVADGRLVNQGGVFTITAADVGIGVPRVDTNYTACSTTGGNEAPGPHPLVNGTIAGQPVHVDTWRQGGEAWVCVRVGAAMLRVVVPAQSVVPPTINYEADTGPLPPRENTALPSDQCEVDGNEHLDLRVGTVDGTTPPGVRVVLGTRQPSPSVVEVCLRVRRVLPGDLNGAVGGRLVVDTGRVDLRPTIDLAEDAAGCTTSLVDLTAPLRVYAALNTGLPASVCVQVGGTARRVTIGTTGGVVLPTVTWVPDPV